MLCALANIARSIRALRPRDDPPPSASREKRKPSAPPPSLDPQDEPPSPDAAEAHEHSETGGQDEERAESVLHAKNATKTVLKGFAGWLTQNVVWIVGPIMALVAAHAGVPSTFDVSLAVPGQRGAAARDTE